MSDQSLAPTDRKLFVTVESEFSIAARAYRIVMKTLEIVEAAPAENFVRTLGATYTEIESIPPVCPAFRSAYDVCSIEQMLSSVWRIGRDIQALEMSLGVPAPWTTAWIDTVVYYTHQSQEAT